jgi:DNA-binding response OmpR family regulator
MIKKILLGEDDYLDKELTVTTLKSIPILNEIVHLDNGQAVLDYIFKQGDFQHSEHDEPGLVILDLKMPKLDGIEVLKQLKKSNSSKHIPVIMLTSSKELKDVIESYGVGANSYVVKPVNIKDFEDAVRAIGFYWALINKTK